MDGQAEKGDPVADARRGLRATLFALEKRRSEGNLSVSELTDMGRFQARIVEESHYHEQEMARIARGEE